MRQSLNVARVPRRLRRQLSPAELWAREAAKTKRRAVEDRLAMQIKAWGLPTPDREYLFHPTRKWQADFAWPDLRLIVEVEGLTPGGGRHQRMKGFEADAEKYAEAQRLGWTVLRLTPTMVRSGYGIRAVQAALERAAWNRQ